jgi:hypothetical protein
LCNHCCSGQAIHTTYRISQPIRCTVIFSLEILEKNNDECILIFVIYWKKTVLLHTKISNHNIIYSSQKPRKSLSLPLKLSSWLFSLDASLSSYKMSTYLPSAHKTQVKIRSHFSGKKSVSYGPGNTVFWVCICTVWFLEKVTEHKRCVSLQH